MPSLSTIPTTTNGKHAPRVGDRVRIERDEIRHPPKGGWPRFAGRRGTVVEINVDRRHPQLTEFGVVFGKVSCRFDGSLKGGDVTWFKRYGIRVLAAVRHAEPPVSWR